jgi:hypothetical protein
MPALRKMNMRRIAVLALGVVLKGTKPSSLPVELPTKSLLVINVSAAKPGAHPIHA